MGDGALAQVRVQTEDTFNGGPGATPTTYDLIADAISGGYSRPAEQKTKIGGDLQLIHARFGRRAFALDVDVEVAPSNDGDIKTMLTLVSGALPSYACHVWDSAVYSRNDGVKLNRAAFRTQNDELLCRLGLLGSGKLASESTTNAIAGFSPWDLTGTNRPYELYQLALTVDSDTAYVREGFEFTLENNLTVGPPQTSPGYASTITEGAQVASGRMTLDQKDLRFLQAQDDETTFDVTAVFTRGASSITFALNTCFVGDIAPTIAHGSPTKVNVTLMPSGAAPWSITVAP